MSAQIITPAQKERAVHFACEVKIGTMKGYSAAPLPVFVEVELRQAKGGTELGMSGHIGAVTFGQIQESIRDGMIRGDFTPYIPEDAIGSMLDIWDRWHLNGMQSGCAHQREMGWSLDRRDNRPGYFRALGPARNPENFAEVALPTRATGEHSAAHIILPGHIWTSANATGYTEHKEIQRRERDRRDPRRVVTVTRKTTDEAGTWDLGEHGPILLRVLAESKYSGDRTASYSEGGMLGRPCPACGYGFGTEWRHEELPAAVIATVKGWADLKSAPPKVKKGQPRPEPEAENLAGFAVRLGLAARFDRDASKDTEHAIGYRYTLMRAGQAEPLSGPFTSGKGNQQPPTIATLLECLDVDASIARDCPTWQDYKDNFGDESHESHEGWKAAKAQTVRLRKLIGPSEMARLSSAVEAG